MGAAIEVMDKPSKFRLLILASVLATAGCTTLSLERHTLAQSESVSDIRYHEVMDNLAMIANNPAALPAYSSIFAGTAQVTDTLSFASTTVWQAKGVSGNTKQGFFTETAIPLVSRNVVENWSLDPLVAPEKLEAIRCACQWVLYGPEKALTTCPGLLASAEQDPSPGRHFDVLDKLRRLPTGWLHIGNLKDVPVCARYRAHCGDKWVWVTKDGMQGLADFTLVLQDIARVNINSDSLFYWPTPPCVYTRISGPPSEEGAGKGPPGPGKAPPGKETRAATDTERMTLEVSAYVNRDGGPLVPGVPYHAFRYENLGSDPSFRSQVSAAGAR
jgi:hypothetical protein